MNHNIIERNERIQKVSQAISNLPERTIVVNDLTSALQHISGVRWSSIANGQIQGHQHHHCLLMPMENHICLMLQ